MKYRVVSTDDHLQEAPDTWTSHMSKAKWGDKIPHIRRKPDGADEWVIFGEPSSFSGISVLGSTETRTYVPRNFDEFPKISYVPSERIKAMDQDGVDVHTFFGNVAGVAGNTFSNPKYTDEEFRADCIRGFNDYQIDAYATPYPGRFITLAILPMWDVKRAVQEVNRMAKRDVKGISFAFPQQYGYPHISDHYWDPLWAAAQEHDLSMNFHIGSGGSQGVGSQNWSGQSPMLNLAEISTKSISANTQVMSTILFSQMLERFPKMKVVSSESGLGWVPYLLEVADHQWERQRLWKEGMAIKPSEYFKRQCFVNFWFEVTGIKMREYIGVDSIMWESDFPHPTSTFPTSWEYINRGLSQVTPEEKQKFLVDNAVKLYHLEKYQD